MLACEHVKNREGSQGLTLEKAWFSEPAGQVLLDRNRTVCLQSLGLP